MAAEKSQIAPFGRGRGRGLLTSKAIAPGVLGDKEIKAPLTSSSSIPVVQTSPAKDIRLAKAFSELETLLESLSFDVEEDDLQTMEQLAKAALISTADMQKFAKTLYDKCLQDREFAKSGAIIADRMSNIEKDGLKFRNCILALVQADYNGREELRIKSMSQFLGFVSFLSQIFGTMRLVNGEVLQPLINPIYDCYHLVLDGEEIDGDECECISSQLQSVGRELQDNCEGRMLVLMDSIRSKIIQDKIKPRIRCTLLEVLECYLRRWQVAPNDVIRFYCDTMAEILAGLID